MSAFAVPIVSGLLQGAAGSLFNRFGTSRRTNKGPKYKRELVDQLLAGLKGSGPFAQLFSQEDIAQISPEAFQRSVTDPLLQEFNTQVAPAIQQRFIASGQQRGTPLDTALARGGLDVQSQIDKLYLPYLQGQQELAYKQKSDAQNRALQIISTILGLPQPTQTTGLTGAGSFLTGLTSGNNIEDIAKGLVSKFGGGGSASGGFNPTQLRRGFGNTNFPSNY